MRLPPYLPAVLLLLGAGPGWSAVGSLQLGVLEIGPRLEVDEEWNDNIFRQKDGRESDFISRIQPGISLKYPFQLNYLTLSYDANWEYYSRYTDLNAFNYSTRGLLFLNFRDFDLSFPAYYSSFFCRPEEETGERDRRTNTVPAVTLSSKFEKIKVDLNYAYDRKFFRDEKIQNREFHCLGISAVWELSPQLKLDGGYDRTFKTFPENSDRDGDDDRVGLVLIGSFPLELTGRIGAGYAVTRGNDTIHNATLDAAISRPLALGPFTSLGLDLVTGTGESEVYSGPYTYYRAKATLRQEFSEKLTGYLPFSWTLNDYPSTTTGDGRKQGTILQAGFSLSYAFRSWLSLRLEYRYSQAFQDQAGRTDELYRENRIKLTAAAAF